MTPRTHPVRFANRQGAMLFGIVHEPDPACARDVAIVLLSPGVKARVAPHRLYTKMAARYAAQGFWVFRFDFYGLGDSEGRNTERLLADLYGAVALGRFVDDTRDALDWFTRTYGVRRFIAGGLCGGAITGVVTADRRHDIVGIIGLGLPVMVEGSQRDPYVTMTAGQARSLRTKYLGKLLDPKSWARLLSFQTDFRLLWRSLRAGRPAPKPPAAAPEGAPAPDDNTNPLFAPALRSLLGRRAPVLLLFSEMDRLWWEFEEKFLQAHQPMLDANPGLVDLAVVPHANHVFTLDEWQADMLGRTSAWLDRRFPRAEGRDAPLAPATASA
jgi:uncharacterized protein